MAIVVRYAARNRPHLAHALWLVVLLKCRNALPCGTVPSALFSWLSPSRDEAPLITTIPAPFSSTPYDVTPFPAQVDSASSQPTLRFLQLATGGLAQCCSFGARASLGRPAIAAFRFALLLTQTARERGQNIPGACVTCCSTQKELASGVGGAAARNDSRIGPAVIGLWRPTILLPACVVRGRAPEELEPIVAHELIHIRRGDLWVGSCSYRAGVVVVSPFGVAGRTDDCARGGARCDEEVIGELRCHPSRYARSLLGVLEWKRVLVPAPGVTGSAGGGR